MILRRYGESYHSVEIAFDSKALSEIGFRRDREHSLAADELGRDYAEVETHSFTARQEGSVHDEVERGALDALARQVHDLEAGLGEDEVLVVLSEQGVDYPKTRTDQKTIVEEGENRLRFTVEIEPPLRIGRYRRRG